MASQRPLRVTQRVSIRDFKARLSHYLAQARSHGMIEITSYRKVVARVTGVSPEVGEGIARLVASGAVSWSGDKPKGASIRLAKRGSSVAEMVLEDRG
jgi:prevent-host-death family protein